MCLVSAIPDFELLHDQFWLFLIPHHVKASTQRQTWGREDMCELKCENPPTDVIPHVQHAPGM